MSSVGNDPDEYSPGNQQDGSYYNPLPDSSQPGLLGGQYADTQVNSAANGAMNWASPSSITDVSGDGTGLPPPVTIAPNLPQMPAATATPAPFNLYDWLHDYLNGPGPSNTLQFAQDLARSFEDNGNRAEAVGGSGVVLGAAAAEPLVALGSGGLFALGALANGAGKVLDGGASFLKSIQQDNNHPLQQFVPRAAEPEFPDLEIPDS